MSTTRREAIAAMIAAALGAAVARGEDPDAGRWVTIQDGGRAWLGPVRSDRSREVIVEGTWRGGFHDGQKYRAVFPRMVETGPNTWSWSATWTPENGMEYGQ